MFECQWDTRDAALWHTGTPRHGTQPEPLVYQIDGALASSLTTRRALIDQQRCFILATNELDTAQRRRQRCGQATRARDMGNVGFAC